MRTSLSIFLAAAAIIGLSACDNASDPKSAEAKEAAGSDTIASSLGGDTATFQDLTKSAGLDTTLAGPGPYTVIIPINAAFDKLPDGALDTLKKPESRPQLTKVLTAHILSGAVLAEDIGKAIDGGNGKTQLMSVGGDLLTATREGDKIVLTDAGGGKAVVTTADQKHSNGVVHLVDGVLTPA
jgi:uncharacterized surface protein with fasciclin (FAS1) repeats